MVDVLFVLDLLGKYGYLLVFLAALAESMPLVGMLIPGQAVVIFAGFLASQGHLHLAPILVAAFVAGILGDLVGYEIGKRYGRGFLERYGPRVRLDAAQLERVDDLFRRYGPFALIAARFSFLTRGLGPLLAGITRMRLPVFWSLNLVGAVAWATAYAALGFAFGESVLLLEGYVGRFVGWGVAIAFGVYLLYRALRAKNPYFTGADAALAVLCAAFTITFARLASAVIGPATLPWLDRGREGLALALAPAEPLWRALAYAGGYPLAVFTVVLFVVLAWRRKWWDAALYGLAVGGNEVVVGTLKVAFARSRPEDAIEALDTFAFPSGHTASAVVFAGATAYVLARKVSGPVARAGILVAATAFVVLVGLGRVALRVHYPSDVVGGFLVGGAWLFAVLLVIEFFVKRTPGARPPRTP